MFFNNWQTIERTLVVGILAYIALVLFLRVSGKRTLSKMNSFDFIVTIALGSTLATILLSKKVALAEGLTAFLVLIGMQYLMTFLSVRSAVFKRIIKAEPDLLFYNGDFIKEAMKKKRILEVEVLQAARTNGISSMKQVEAVVLETDGSISVIKTTEKEEQSTLSNTTKPE
ncbi:DUF421 domain-containing protein [Terribacillus halophilus]|uniref:DUF421 domain-containing protein n=1 Tax=Terribacillus halophilus TaxID=361279 RepID=UPI0009866D9A|nr:YetF domain-containing protein [Terribacillus halophilus]